MKRSDWKLCVRFGSSVTKWFFSFLFFWLAILPAHAGNLIRWSQERRLTWDDFRAIADVNRNPNVQAIAMVGLEVQTNVNGAIAEIRVASFFDKTGSWTINRTSAYILQHEQLHFDIAELHARILRKKLKAIKNVTFSNLKNKVEEAHRIVQQAHEAFQRKYDRDTNHSNNVQMQELWNQKIPDLLNELSAYRNELIILSVGR